MNLSHKIRLHPNKEQTQGLRKACGCSRFAWNWGLREWERQYKEGLKPTAFKLNKQFNAIKKQQFPWIYESPKDCNQRPFINLGKAFTKFIKEKKGHPKLHKRGRRDSFYISNDKARIVEDKWIQVPLLGKIRLAENPRFSGKIMSYTVSLDVDQWFVSIAYELPDPSNKITNQEVLGIDLGLKHFAVLSDGTKIENPKLFKKIEKQRVRAERRLAKKQKGSANRRKARVRLAKIHRKLRRQRQDFIHKFTSGLAKTKQELVIEDLKVSNMLKNHKLAQSIANVCWGELRRQLEYKTRRYGSLLTVVSTFFPSSKLCSCCGFKLDKLNLSVREWACPKCSTVHDRDLNAAMNLKSQSKSVGWVTPEVKPVENPPSGNLSSGSRCDLLKQEHIVNNVITTQVISKMKTFVGTRGPRVVVYPRMLSGTEIKDFELEPLGYEEQP